MKSDPIRRGAGESELFLHEVEKLSEAGSRVLDLGAGHGTFGYDKYRATIVALDHDVLLMAGYRSKPGHYVVGEAGSLPFLGEQFDVVVANFVFEHFGHPDGVLAEANRVLTTGSLMYMAIPNADSLEDRLFRLLGGRKEHVQSYTFHSLLRLVYRQTTMKLIAFADWPAGFTWLNRAVEGGWLRRVLFYVVKCFVRMVRSRTRSDSGFVFLFRKESTSGFRLVTHVCRYCGGGSTQVNDGVRRWKCIQCRRVNE